MKKVQKVIIFLFCLLIFKVNVVSAQVKLSDNAQLSVLTCSEGDELYSAFGHSAIRVLDDEKKIDIVFNYGVFDFDTPNFYLKFANGKLNYMLSVSDYKRFVYSYMRENRSIIEQVLNLNQAEKQRLFEALVDNYKPENRYYKYDFFYDNCATRVFNIIDKNINGSLHLDGSKNPKKTFRQYLHHYLVHSPWIETGLKVILGMPADKIASLKESTFLPDYMHAIFNYATITKSNQTDKIIKKETLLLEKSENTEKTSVFPDPLLFFCLLLIFLVLISIILRRLPFLVHIVFRIVLIATGLTGALILYLWLITDHTVTANNLNILWSSPGLLLLGCIRLKKNILTTFLIYLHLVAIGLFLLLWKFLPQDLPFASIPYSLLLLYILVFFKVKFVK